MTLDEAVAEVVLGLGFRRDLALESATQIRIAQQYFERSWPEQSLLPWFLITERAVTSTVINEERLTKPTDWLGDVEDDALWLTNTLGKEILIEKSPLDDLRQLYQNASPGFPQGYGFDGYYYRLFPKPDAAYAARMQYYQKDTLLVSGADTNKWLTEAPDILIGRAGAVLAGAGGNARLTMFLERMSGAISTVNARSIWIKEMNDTPQMNSVA
jgi:hypothetical protein